MILKVNNIEVTGTVEECLEFLEKYDEKFLITPLIYPDYPGKLEQPNLYKPYVTYTSGDCSECEWFKSLGDKPYVGDTPCNWCVKRQPMCYGSGSLSSVKNETSKGKKDKDVR